MKWALTDNRHNMIFTDAVIAVWHAQLSTLGPYINNGDKCEGRAERVAQTNTTFNNSYYVKVST